MDDRNFFNNLAPSWDANETLSTPEKINQILDLLNINKGEAILDLGTGTGVLLPYLAQRVGERGKITAVDYSEGMLNQAKKKFTGLCPEPEFLNLDFENENIDGEFDKIILYCVYPHLHTPVETLKWLKKVNLKKGGNIVVAFPCSEGFINNIHKEKHSESDKLLPPDQLAHFFNNNGLDATVLSDSEESYVIAIS